MKISIVGAGGGIGRSLVKLFASRHEVTGVYRSTPRPPLVPAGPTIAFDDQAALSSSVAKSEVVIHAALNTRAGGRAFIAENRAITEKLLSLLAPGVCRLFVYFSSQVVYAASGASVCTERQSLAGAASIDSYTRLKIADETAVIERCRAVGIPYLVVRPTVVMGPGMQWSSGIVSAMRYAPVGVRGRTMNLIHVDDLSTDLLRLVELGVGNDIFNLGDRDVSTDEYFRCAASVAHRKARFLPDGLAGALSRLLPSTLWFLAKNVRIDCSRIKALSARDRVRSLSEYFPQSSWRISPNDVETIAELARSGQSFRTHGQGFSSWFNDHPDTRHLSLARYSGIVGLAGDLVTVKSGTPLTAILKFLDQHDLTLATLPEFGGISAGACFFTEVHGSSSEHVSMYDLIEQIRYVDETGSERVSKRDPALWDELRRMPRGIVVTQVTFGCVAMSRLSNRIEWRPDIGLDEVMTAGRRANMSTTIQWYPLYKQLLVYNVAPARNAEPGDVSPFLPLRGLPYLLQRLLIAAHMRGRKRIVGKAHEILAPWKAVPARHLVGTALGRMKMPIRNMELCVPAFQACDFLGVVRRAIGDGTLRLGRHQGIGIRFSAHPATGRAFVWIETTSRDLGQLHQIVRLARAACGSELWFHRGKYVPPGTPLDALFVPRQAAPIRREPVAGRLAGVGAAGLPEALPAE